MKFLLYRSLGYEKHTLNQNVGWPHAVDVSHLTGSLLSNVMRWKQKKERRKKYRAKDGDKMPLLIPFIVSAQLYK